MPAPADLLPVHVGLIRAIGPVTHAKMPMAALREACVQAGFVDVTTVMATGNLLFRSAAPPDDLRQRLAGIIAGFGLTNAVIVRRGAELVKAAEANPFAAAAAERPSTVVAFFLAAPARDTAWLEAHDGPERLSLDGLTLYADYGEDLSVSKLTPAKIERRLGVTTTFRNFNTISRLAAAVGRMIEAP